MTHFPNTNGYSVLGKFTVTRSECSNIIRLGNVILKVMHFKVLIMAAAALIKECVTPHTHSPAYVWQINPAFILTFAERHSDIIWPSTTKAEKKEGLKAPVSDCT